MLRSHRNSRVEVNKQMEYNCEYKHNRVESRKKKKKEFYNP